MQDLSTDSLIILDTRYPGDSVHESLIYKQASDYVVRISKQIFVVINGSISLFYSTPLIKVAVDVLIGQYSRDSWTLMYQVR